MAALWTHSNTLSRREMKGFINTPTIVNFCESCGNEDKCVLIFLLNTFICYSPAVFSFQSKIEEV